MRVMLRAFVLVTGDKDFADVDVEPPAIMTPADYVKRFIESR